MLLLNPSLKMNGTFKYATYKYTGYQWGHVKLPRKYHDACWLLNMNLDPSRVLHFVSSPSFSKLGLRESCSSNKYPLQMRLIHLLPQSFTEWWTACRLHLRNLVLDAFNNGNILDQLISQLLQCCWIKFKLRMSFSNNTEISVSLFDVFSPYFQLHFEFYTLLFLFQSVSDLFWKLGFIIWSLLMCWCWAVHRVEALEYPCYTMILLSSSLLSTYMSKWF